jgi:hypothetical protein
MRLGDEIDDHCSRCKRSLTHSIVAMSGEEVLQVRCRTCNAEHKYRHNRSGKKKMTAQEAFQRVLASVSTAQGAVPEKPSKKKKS